MSEAGLVPGRGCGDCTVCCIVPGIDTREAQKDTNSACRHLQGGGCAIYAARPSACRTFFCAWRQMAALDEHWRPDRSGVLAQQVTLGARPGLSLTLTAAPLKTARQDWFVAFVAQAVRDGLPLLLAVPGPRGHQSAKALLNTEAMRRAATGTREQARQVLRQLVKELLAKTPEKLPLLNRGNDMSGT